MSKQHDKIQTRVKDIIEDRFPKTKITRVSEQSEEKEAAQEYLGDANATACDRLYSIANSNLNDLSGKDVRELKKTLIAIAGQIEEEKANLNSKINAIRRQILIAKDILD